MKLLTAKQAGKILKVHHSRVRVLIREGRLPAEKMAGVYIIKEKDLEFVKDRKPGRPKTKGVTVSKSIIAGALIFLFVAVLCNCSTLKVLKSGWAKEHQTETCCCCRDSYSHKDGNSYTGARKDW